MFLIFAALRPFIGEAAAIVGILLGGIITRLQFPAP